MPERCSGQSRVGRSKQSVQTERRLRRDASSVELVGAPQGRSRTSGNRTDSGQLPERPCHRGSALSSGLVLDQRSPCASFWRFGPRPDGARSTESHHAKGNFPRPVFRIPTHLAKTDNSLIRVRCERESGSRGRLCGRQLGRTWTSAALKVQCGGFGASWTPGYSRGGDSFRRSPPADVWLVISALLQLCLQLLQARLVLARVVTAEQQFSS